MLDIKFIRDNEGVVAKAAKDKGLKVDLGRLLQLDERRRSLITQLDEMNKRRKEISQKRDVEQGKKVKLEINEAETELRQIDAEFRVQMLAIPNLPAADVKVGENESGNEVLRKVGTIPKFAFAPKEHLELGESLDVIDVERAAKVSGTRFAYLKNEGVLLEFGLIELAVSTLLKEGFISVVPPVLIRKSITDGLGYWQAGGNEEYYWVREDKVAEEEEHKGLYLVGTAEHSVVPMHKDEVLSVKELPKRYVAFSSAFRREAGAYGKDTKGILRVHQFDKVEMVSFVAEEGDDQEHEYLLSLQEKLFQMLKLPYQVIKMCTGDLGFPVARKYDLEAWLPGQDKYREVTSTSTTTDFQARRLNIRYQAGNTRKFVHILNGTGFAIGRTIIAILENYQQKDGSVRIPRVLQKYVGKEILKPR